MNFGFVSKGQRAKSKENIRDFRDCLFALCPLPFAHQSEILFYDA
jgi:hypothetical protein